MPGGGAGAEGPPAGVLARFAAARAGRLARLSPEGPRLVPVTFAWHAGAAVWAVDDVKPKRGRLRRLDDLAADARCALLVDHYEEDWSALWWVELQGLAATLAGDDAEAALQALAARYPAYRRSRPPGPVVAVRPRRWRWWSALPDCFAEPGATGTRGAGAGSAAGTEGTGAGAGAGADETAWEV